MIGTEVTIEGKMGAYESSDPEEWPVGKFDTIVEGPVTGEVIAHHPTLKEWWIVRVQGNLFVPAHESRL